MSNSGTESDKESAVVGYTHHVELVGVWWPWVAQITGKTPLGFERKFIDAERDYTYANDQCTLGVFFTFHLQEGLIYQLAYNRLRKNHKRFFARVRSGALFKMSRKEVLDAVPEIEPADNLPQLQGSETQIAQAAKIRALKMGELDEIFAGAAGDELTLRAAAEIKAQTAAHVWIDNRHNNAFYMLRGIIARMIDAGEQVAGLNAVGKVGQEAPALPARKCPAETAQEGSDFHVESCNDD